VTELVYQLLAGGTGDEGFDDVGVCDVGELGALLGESPDEVSKGLIGLLPIAPEVLGVSRTHVCALEVPDEDLDLVAQSWNMRSGRCSSHALAESAR